MICNEDAVERMSPDLPVMVTMGHEMETGGAVSVIVPPPLTSPSDQPRDLSIRRKIRTVPPPLDLSKRTLDHHHHSGSQQYSHGGHQPQYHQIQRELQSASTSPRSPFTQKNLPLRKRAHSWSSQPGQLTMSTYASSNTITTIKDEEGEPIDDYTYSNKSSSNTSLRIAGLPTPQTPHTPHPHSAIPVLTSKFNFCESSSSAMQSAGPLNLSTGGGLPSSLLSPAPSHPSTSSLSSSREELEGEPMLLIDASSIGASHQHSSYHNHYHNHHHHHHYSNNTTNISSSASNLGCSSPMLHSDDSSSRTHHQYTDSIQDSSSVSNIGGSNYLKQEQSSSLYTKVELIRESVLYTQPEEENTEEDDTEQSSMLLPEEHHPSLSHPLTPYSTRLYSIKDEEYHTDLAYNEELTAPSISDYHTHHHSAVSSPHEHIRITDSPSTSSMFRHSRYSDDTTPTPFPTDNKLSGASSMIDMTYSNGTLTPVSSSSGHYTSSHHQSSHSHQWPTTVWSIFMAGVRIHFVMGKHQATQMQLSEELQKLESKYQHRYAPYGLQVKRCNPDIEVSSSILNGIHGNGVTDSISNSNVQLTGTDTASQLAHLYLKPITTAQEDIMALVPAHHPFYVKDKGWCSVDPEQCRQVYNVPCSQLCEGDLCLPPHHPEHSLHHHHLHATPPAQSSSDHHYLHHQHQPRSSNENNTPEPPQSLHSTHHPSIPTSVVYSNSNLSAYQVPSVQQHTPPSSIAATAHTHTPDFIADNLRRFDFNDEPVNENHGNSRSSSLSSGRHAISAGPSYSNVSGGSLLNYSSSHHHSLPLHLHSQEQPPPPPPSSLLTPSNSSVVHQQQQHYNSSNSNNNGSSRSSSVLPLHYASLTPVQRSVFLSPPASPSKKSSGVSRPPPPPSGAGGVDSGAGGPSAASSQQTRPRRPMNGFMLFAKRQRLKLIQQHPGKDNRAISVLLGATWKGLPEADRERINAEARVQAEARKRIDPDCWKRKRSHSTS